jgi:phytoene dehydrogenase-like protein
VVDAVMVELLPANYETLRRDFDELRYGQFLPVPLLGLGSLSQFDPSRVPDGKQILHMWDYVPYQRPDGASWDDTKQQYADHIISPRIPARRRSRDDGRVVRSYPRRQ